MSLVQNVKLQEHYSVSHFKIALKIHYTKFRSPYSNWYNFRIDQIKVGLIKSLLQMLGMAPKKLYRDTLTTEAHFHTGEATHGS